MRLIARSIWDLPHIMSTLRKIVSVNAIVGVSLAFGLINNIAITGIFGLNRSVDAYFASFVLINMFMFLVIDFLGKNFLPIFAIRRESSEESASELTSLVVTQIGFLAVIFAVFLVTFAEPLFTLILPGFSGEEISVVRRTFTIMAPSIVLMTINAFHEYVWQHNEQYNRVVSARIFVPVTLTVFILLLHEKLGTQALPYGFLCGQVLCAVFLMIGVPYKYRFKVGLKDEDFLKIIRNSGILMSTGFIARSRLLIVQYFGSLLGEGAISAMVIAQKICQPIYESALLGMRMILFSRSAKAVARADIESFARMHNRALAGVFFLTAPVATWYAVEGELIVRTLFQRGAFTDEMVSLVYAALLGLSGSVIFAGTVQMASNAFYALDRVKVPATVMPVSTIAFLIIASMLAPKLGVIGLTGATSLVGFVTFLVLMWKLKKQVAGLDIGSIARSLLKYLAAAVLAVSASRLVTNEVEADKIVEFFLSMSIVGVVYIIAVWSSGDSLLRTMIEKSGFLENAFWRKRR